MEEGNDSSEVIATMAESLKTLTPWAAERYRPKTAVVNNAILQRQRIAVESEGADVVMHLGNIEVRPTRRRSCCRSGY